nr:GATA-type zinc finger protein 1 isoform X2 [Doryrhamphus excisus]
MHGSVMDANTLSWQSVKKESDGADLCQTSNTLSSSPFERDETMLTKAKMQTMLRREAVGGGHSPLRVLSLINLQCKRLMDQGHMEPNVRALSSTIRGANYPQTESFEHAWRPRPVAGASACITPINNEQEFLASEPQSGVKESKSISQKDTPPSLSKETKTSSETSLEGQQGASSVEYLHPSGSSVSLKHTPKVFFGSQTDFDLNIVDLSKPALTLDHNANLKWILGGQHSKPDGRNASKSESVDPIEAKRQEGNDAPVTCHCSPKSSERTRIPRKQPNPSRSVDIRNPHLQGVTFRIDAELDDSRENCRLLITSKYSKKPDKSARKPRTRTRTSEMTSSSEEETNTTSRIKMCASCCTRKTPMWRDAEDGTPLCNACGIRYKKYRVRCNNCWHIPRKESNSSSHCLKCGNFVRITSTQHKNTS